MAKRPVLCLAALVVWLGTAAASIAEEIGTLHIGFREDAPPFSSRVAPTAQTSNTGVNETDFEGFSVDICQDVVNGLLKATPELKVEQFGFTAATRPFAKNAGMLQFDLLCDPTSITIERLQDCSFSFPYFVTGITFVTVSEASTLETLTDAKVGFVGNTTAEARLKNEWQRRFGKKPDIVPFEDYGFGVEALSEKQIEAVFGDQVLLQQAVKEKGVEFVVSDNIISIELYGFCVNPRNPGLLKATNETLARLYASGRIYKYLSRHFDGRGASPLLATLYRVYAVPE